MASNKNSATPSWCLWACAFTAALWLLFIFLRREKGRMGCETVSRGRPERIACLLAFRDAPVAD